MSLKQILVIHPIHDPVSALDSAIEFARSHNARLDILVLNLADIPTIPMTPNPEHDWNTTFSEPILATEKREQDVTAYMEKSGLPCSVQSECAQHGLIDDLVATAALCTDVVIFTNRQSSFVSGLIAQALDGALLDAGKPVLVLNGSPQASLETPEKIVIAWDDVSQAAHAVQAAIPILQRAKTVEIMVVIEKSAEATAFYNTEKLTTWLELHGIATQVSTVRRDGQLVSHALADYIEEQPCDLLVMGAYSHSRISERLFAGATHIALTDINVPLLIAH